VGEGSVLLPSSRGPEFEGSVWTLLVEVAHVDAEDVFELALFEDQQPFEALPAHAAGPSAPPGRSRSAPGA
jgi:hypothetical protein